MRWRSQLSTPGEMLQDWLLFTVGLIQFTTPHRSNWKCIYEPLVSRTLVSFIYDFSIQIKLSYWGINLTVKCQTFRYFWLAVTATIAGILCACSLWRKHSQGRLCCRSGTNRNRTCSEPDSIGSCYAPPHYNSCNNFQAPPPPYSEVLVTYIGNQRYV